MGYHHNFLHQLSSLSKRKNFWFSLGLVSGLFAWNPLDGYKICLVEGESMQPTLNPKYSKFRDWVVIEKFKNSENIVKSSGSIVFAIKNDRRLVKRLAFTDDHDSDVSDIKCWLESDNPGYYYDSNIFGYISGSNVKGKVVAIIFPFHRFKIFD